MTMKLNTELKLLSAAIMSLALAACSGDDGDDGRDGAPGAPGEQGPPGQDGQDLTRSSLSRLDVISNVNNAFYVNDEGRISEMSPSDLREIRGSARNVILFVGDGMGPSTVTAARIRDGELKGMAWEDGVSTDFAGPESNDLSFDRFPFAGLVKVYNTNSQVPDSAGTMGAMVTGVKTDIGVFGYDETVERGDCTTGTMGNQLVTSLELAEIAGMSTGIVTTARITHATPGANYAKSVDRNYEDISDIPGSSNCFGVQEDIASQLISFESRLDGMGYDVDGIEVAMGGGRRHFIPNDTAFNVEKPVGAGAEGDRTDGRDLPTEWAALYPDGVYVTDSAGFDAIDPDATDKVLGLFNESHMQYELDRGNDIAGEPSLSEMTAKAIQILDNNPDGYFLQVESGRIDHAHHAGNAAGALADTIEFAKAVQAAINLTSDEDTLILVTADHSHVMTIGGYVKRGNPILGKAVYAGSDTEELAADGLPFTTLGYTNGIGFCDLGAETDSDAGYGCTITSGRVDISSVDTEAPGFHQEALIPLTSETHSGEDIALYANGPGASLVRGTNEQNVVFHITDYALDLIAKANAAAD
jgi:alkaline phosphatase